MRLVSGHLFVFVLVRVDEGLEADVEELGVTRLAPGATGAQSTPAGPPPPKTSW